LISSMLMIYFVYLLHVSLLSLLIKDFFQGLIYYLTQSFKYYLLNLKRIGTAEQIDVTAHSNATIRVVITISPNMASERNYA
jgi:hypothetical protein